MKRKKNSSRWPLVILIIGISVLSYAAVRSSLPKPQSADIFLVTDDASLKNGKNMISGILQKNTSENKNGQYLILLDDLQIVYLNITDIDHLIGQKVVAEGLVVAPEAGIPGFMTVSTITVEGSR